MFEVERIVYQLIKSHPKSFLGVKWQLFWNDGSSNPTFVSTLERLKECGSVEEEEAIVGMERTKEE